MLVKIVLRYENDHGLSLIHIYLVKRGDIPHHTYHRSVKTYPDANLRYKNADVALCGFS